LCRRIGRQKIELRGALATVGLERRVRQPVGEEDHFKTIGVELLERGKGRVGFGLRAEVTVDETHPEPATKPRLGEGDVGVPLRAQRTGEQTTPQFRVGTQTAFGKVKWDGVGGAQVGVQGGTYCAGPAVALNPGSKFLEPF
jgi:hypothetical protein